MIELRYNADGKLEYRTAITVGQFRGLYANFDAGGLRWDEWKIVPSEPVDNNLRTERVVLEVRHCDGSSASKWLWHEAMAEYFPTKAWQIKSVRVVDEADADPAKHRWDNDGERCIKCNDKDWMGGSCNTPDDEYIARLTAERDAARAENTLLWQAIGLATTAVPHLEIKADDPVGMMQCIVSRVAELEAASAVPSWPRGWLTAEERGRLAAFAEYADDHDRRDVACLLRSLLARESPPRVKVPHLDDLAMAVADSFEVTCKAWIAAIRAAGMEVEE